jgi:hypothetical protein
MIGKRLAWPHFKRLAARCTSAPWRVRDNISGMATQTVPLTESKILRAYADKTPRSRALYERAKALLPNGVRHVGRYLEPHPVYILLHGVDIVGWPGGVLSAAHTEEDVRRTVDAFDATLEMLAEEGDW